MDINYCKTTVYRIFLMLLLFTVINNSVSAQDYYSKSKRAIKYYKNALSNFNLQYFNIVEEDLQKALKIDNNFLDVYILKAQVEIEKGNLDIAIKNFDKALNIDSLYKKLIYLKKAELELKTGKYKNAKTDFIIYKKIKKISESKEKYIDRKIKECNFAINAMKNPINFEPINIGKEINSVYSEYWPSLTGDNRTITFTRSNRETNSQEDLYISKKISNNWATAKSLGTPINTPKSEGAQSISFDGKTMVFTACLRKDTYGSCDIYISNKIGNKWTKPVNIGLPINTRYKETQPSLSADGKTLYFVSNRAGGKGRFDIWCSKMNIDNKWSIPVNLGDSINTYRDELAPFIHYDNKTLYFTSNGHLGMGGSDIFISRRTEKNSWTKAKNFGYPANTHFNEESLIVTTEGDFGLFSSDIKGGFGQKDIYYFKMPKKNKPYKYIFAKGVVYDISNNKKIAAKIEFTNIKDSSNINTFSDNYSGAFLVCLSPKNNYAINIFEKGYLPYSDKIEMADSNLFFKIPLTPIKENESFVLKNIFFDIDSYKLKSKSFIELNKLIKYLELNNSISIEIQGHTDNNGTKKYNYKLSDKRALSVYNYLIYKSIDKKRIGYKGYGYDKPIATNKTKKGRSKNRRTEFKILTIN